MDQLPPLAPRPAPPRLWVWLTLLLLFFLLGMGLMLMFGGQAVEQDVMSFWSIVVGGPLLVWSGASFIRAVVFIGQQRAADGWDEARENDWKGLLRCGRRSQQILAANFFTQLRDTGEGPVAQLDALIQGAQALTRQPSRLDGATVFHSRLPGQIDEAPERAMLRVLTQLLADLSQTLTPLPDDAPLALLLEVDSRLPEKQVRQIWQQAWGDAGIRQSTSPIEGRGLAALDQWLDQRISDQAMLLVVALQCAPDQLEETAEAAVGILFGNRLTQTTLPPVAYLHRPEQGRESNTDALRYAMHQSLEWVPLQSSSIEQVWRAGIDTQSDAALTTVLTESLMPSKPNQGLCNLDALLGHAGTVSPWLAIAAATQSVQRGVGPQFIFSGERSVEARLWATVLTPALPLSK